MEICTVVRSTTNEDGPAHDRVLDLTRGSEDRAWVSESVRKLEADATRSSDTPLHVVPLPASCGVDLYLKDESGHPTGSLKHRLARSLLVYGLCNGWIGRTSTLVDASSGSTAVSEAWFARLIGLPFVAVMPRWTSCEKVKLIQRYGGSCHFVDDASTMYSEAARLATERGGHYLDQFTYAERATDWRGNNNIAESIFDQLRAEPHPTPAWIVVGAGTGGTSATIGRYLRYRGFSSKLAVVDPEGSAFLEGWSAGNPLATGTSSRIEGIGRPRVEPSFVPAVVDRMMRIPDAGSIAAMHWLAETTGRRAGPSTGTNLVGCMLLAEELTRAGQKGSLVTLLCDDGDRYLDTYYSPRWLSEQAIDIASWRKRIATIMSGLGGQHSSTA